MIHRIFLLVTSCTLLLAAAPQCPDHYNPKWFEESSDELNALIEEYFLDHNLSFPPTKKEMLGIGLQQRGGHLQLPHATVSYGELAFPVKTGLWRYDMVRGGINTTHLLLKEPTKLSEIEAINTYNDLLGAYWGDYAVTGYQMTLLVEDSRIRYQDRYFELNVKIYGLKNDATPLKRSYADILFTDYTRQVDAFVACEKMQ